MNGKKKKTGKCGKKKKTGIAHLAMILIAIHHAHTGWAKHFRENVECKLCHKKLPYYELHVKEPWTFNPVADGPATIGLEIYGPIGCRKEILHSYYDDDNCEVLHISVEGKEKLVKLLHSHPSK